MVTAEARIWVDVKWVAAAWDFEYVRGKEIFI
jgi:hypothetical protein